MKIARFFVTPELLRELLHSPGTTTIVWAGMDHHEIELTVEDPGLREVELRDDDRPPLVRPTFRAQAPAVLVDWNQT